MNNTFFIYGKNTPVKYQGLPALAIRRFTKKASHETKVFYDVRLDSGRVITVRKEDLDFKQD